MNALAPAPSLVVDMVHDFICPWCYLGVRRLRAALALMPAGRIDITWRPFLLNPDMPRGGVSRGDYLRQKFGGDDRARRLQGAITELGLREGLSFRFERIRRTPPSLDAHRLVRWATRFGRADALVEALFAAYFADGRDIGEGATLAAIAGACGLRATAARAFLDSGDETDAVHADNLRAHRLGISGVPCFVVGGTHAIAGAQEPEVIARLLQLAATGSETLVTFS